jgi:hypothetical protein
MPFPIDEYSKEVITSHFRRKRLVWSEDYFIQKLDNPGSKYDVYFATIALRDCGTEKCIPSLKAKIYYPMQDVKCTSLLTIAHIAREKESDFYAQCLLDTKYREKGYAMWAINDAADQRAVEAVCAYFEKNNNKFSRGLLANGTVVDGINFLLKQSTISARAKSFLNYVKEIWFNLPQGERQELIKNAPYFERYEFSVDVTSGYTKQAD